MGLAVALLWLAQPVLVSLIIDRAIIGGDRRLLIILAGSMLGLALCILLLEALRGYCLALAGERVVRSVRVMLFESLQRQSHGFFVRTSSGAISSRMWNDTSSIQAVGLAFYDVFGAVVLLISTLVFMFIWSWTLALLCVSVLPLILGASIFLGQRNQKIEGRLLSHLERLVAFTFERLNINGFMLINGLGYDKRLNSKRFADGASELLKLSVAQSMTMQGIHITLVVFPILIAAILYLYGGSKVIDGDFSLGKLTAYIGLSAMLVSHVSALANLNVNVMGSLAPFRRIFAWLDLTPEIEDSEDAIDLSSIQGHVSFKDVSFEYETGTPILKDLSFQILAGQLIALVGPSGAGKTTVTYLMLRFYDPTSGCIEIDRHDLRNVRLASLRQHVGVVPQENIVFNATVKENMLVAKPDADDEELIASCKAAQLHELVEKLPHGYDSMLGEFGYRLSGGERQRLAIARVALKRPSILIMDEPTSSLDSVTERAIREALMPLLRESTTVVIAHRLSTILSADVVLVLDEGRLVDAGRHDELLDRCDLYRRLFQEQFAAQSKDRSDV